MFSGLTNFANNCWVSAANWVSNKKQAVTDRFFSYMSPFKNSTGVVPLEAASIKKLQDDQPIDLTYPIYLVFTVNNLMLHALHRFNNFINDSDPNYDELQRKYYPDPLIYFLACIAAAILGTTVSAWRKKNPGKELHYLLTAIPSAAYVGSLSLTALSAIAYQFFPGSEGDDSHPIAEGYKEQVLIGAGVASAVMALASLKWWRIDPRFLEPPIAYKLLDDISSENSSADSHQPQDIEVGIAASRSASQERRPRGRVSQHATARVFEHQVRHDNANDTSRLKGHLYKLSKILLSVVECLGASGRAIEIIEIANPDLHDDSKQTMWYCVALLLSLITSISREYFPKSKMANSWFATSLFRDFVYALTATGIFAHSVTPDGMATRLVKGERLEYVYEIEKVKAMRGGSATEGWAILLPIFMGIISAIFAFNMTRVEYLIEILAKELAKIRGEKNSNNDLPEQPESANSESGVSGTTDEEQRGESSPSSSSTSSQGVRIYQSRVAFLSPPPASQQKNGARQGPVNADLPASSSQVQITGS